MLGVENVTKTTQIVVMHHEYRVFAIWGCFFAPLGDCLGLLGRSWLATVGSWSLLARSWALLAASWSRIWVRASVVLVATGAGLVAKGSGLLTRGEGQNLVSGPPVGFSYFCPRPTPDTGDRGSRVEVISH